MLHVNGIAHVSDTHRPLKQVTCPLPVTESAPGVCPPPRRQRGTSATPPPPAAKGTPSNRRWVVTSPRRPGHAERESQPSRGCFTHRTVQHFRPPQALQTGSPPSPFKTSRRCHPNQVWPPDWKLWPPLPLPASPLIPLFLFSFQNPSDTQLHPGADLLVCSGYVEGSRTAPGTLSNSQLDGQPPETAQQPRPGPPG